LLYERAGKKISKSRQMLIDYLKSDSNPKINNAKKLRKFLELILEEIDNRKVMRGI
jgi:hypothetical protein